MVLLKILASLPVALLFSLLLVIQLDVVVLPELLEVLVFLSSALGHGGLLVHIDL